MNFVTEGNSLPKKCYTFSIILECDSSALASRVGIKPDEASLSEQTVTQVCFTLFGHF